MKLDGFGLLALVGIGVYLWSRNADAAVYQTTASTPESQGPAPDIGANDMTTPTPSQPQSSLTRGERNNNPGNIVKSSITWQGLAPDQSGDSRFAQFVSPEYGIRALGVLLQGYSAKGFNTVRTIINRYAPSSENNTSAYIQAVSTQIGVGPDDELDFTSKDTLSALVAAIIQHENGRNIYLTTGQLDAGINMIG